MQIERDLLLQILTTIKPAIPKKGDEDMLKRVIFTGHDVVAFSEDVVMAWPLEADFASVVPSEELINMLQKITAKEVDLIYSKDQLNVKAANVRARLKTEPGSPLIEEVMHGVLTEADNATWYQMPTGLNEAINLCKYSASKDATQLGLTCVHVAGNQVVASDDFRISQYVMAEEFAGDVLIKATVAVQMGKFNFTQYAITDQWAMFLDVNNVLLASRLVQEGYGDITPYMQFEGTQYEMPSTLAQRVEQVAVLAKGDYDIEKEVKVYLKNGVAIVRAEKEVGWAEATAKHAQLLVQQPVAFTINPVFLAEVLRLTDNTITLGPDKALFEKQMEAGYFKHLISLSLIAEV